MAETKHKYVVLLYTSTIIHKCELLFLQIYDICKNSGSPIVTTSGMTFEGNTRRFVVDEKKEKYYRAEVENRFLKRKLTQVSSISQKEYCFVQRHYFSVVSF